MLSKEVLLEWIVAFTKQCEDDEYTCTEESQDILAAVKEYLEG